MPIISTLQQGNAVGRSNGTPQAAPAPAPAVPAAPANSAQQGAPPPNTSPTSGLMMLLPFVLLFGLIWWMQRGEKKKRSELEGKLKKGDRIITRAGFIGKLTELGERTARVELAPGVNITMLRSHIEGLDGGDTTPASKSSAGKSSKAADSKKKKK